MFQVEFEIILGLWLLSGLHRRLSWLAALCCFAMFSGVTLYKGLSGDSTCGCFGVVEVNPWHTLILDVTAVVALLVFRPDLRRSHPVRHYAPKLAVAVILALAAGIPAGIAMGRYTPATITSDGEILGDSNFVVLRTETWVGWRFPLLKHIDVGEELRTGQWHVLLYHHDCPACQETVPLYIRLARKLAAQAGNRRVAFIEVPPYGTMPERRLLEQAPVVWGQLSEERDWFVSTPAGLLLSDAVVIRFLGTASPEGHGP